MRRRLAATAALLLIASTACDDEGGGSTPVANDAAPEDAARGDAAPVDAAPVDAAVDVCVLDRDCADDRYCRVTEGELEGACAPGCRTSPDSCEADEPRTFCDAASRACVGKPCEADGDCDAGRWCDDGTCRVGCRLGGEDCADEAAPSACDPATHTCRPLAACCSAGDACSLTLDGACEGQRLVGVTACDPLPCTARCARDAECDVTEYCDSFGRCRGGCRVDDPGSCAPDERCAPTTRRCVQALCSADDECAVWQYCDGLRCQTGCRTEPDTCEDGLRCDAARTCRPICVEDADCPAGFCDVAARLCRPPCDPATHLPCAAGERCDADTARCVPGCADDALGDAVPALGNGEASERVVCPGLVDRSTVALGAGERVQLTLGYDAATGGPLTLRLVDADGAVLVVDAGLDAPRVLRFPALGAPAWPGGDVHVEVLGPRRTPYQLEVAVGRCFADARDPGDDAAATATPAGRRQRDRFTDAWQGSVCRDDVDFYCFPMVADDGLLMNLVAPAGCDALRPTLAPRARFEAGDAESLPVTTAAGPAGETVYRALGEAEAGAFTDEMWCLRVAGAAADAQCEDYDLSLEFLRRGTLCTDALEPNDGLAAAAPLDGEGLLAAADGRLPTGVDLELPLTLELCEGEVDLFRFQADERDVLRAWLESEDVRGELTVQLLDAEGQARGDVGRVTSRAADARIALTIAPTADTYYVRVAGQAASTGRYRLFVRREMAAGVCAEDLHELPDVRNDLSADASVLMPADGRATVKNAAICDPAADRRDEDWYRFVLPEDANALCVEARFQNADGDLDLMLFRSGAGGPPCGAGGSCAEGFCVEGRCAEPVDEASTTASGEFVHLARGEAEPGVYFARVFGAGMANNTYDLTLSQVPAQVDACLRDFREREQANDDPRTATDLGARRAVVCDAWLCRNERASGDWYRVHVPARADRTVHLSFAPRTDGTLLLGFVDPENPAAATESAELQASVQCLNIEGGPTGVDVFVGVTADTIVDDGDSRVDYVLQVAPTDLARTPRGACDTLSGGLFRHLAWPTARIVR